MKCPHCDSSKNVQITISSPYFINNNNEVELEVNKPIKIKYCCKQCGKTFTNIDIVLKVFQNHKGKLYPGTSIEGISGYIIGSESGLPIHPEMIEAVLDLEKKGRIEFMQIDREHLGVIDFIAKIKE